jgi:hypothetical protein
MEVLTKSLKSASAFERATVAKSFKFGASKETSSMDLQMSVEDLIDLTKDSDINVRGNVFESLTAITHTSPNSVKPNVDVI